MQPRPVIDESGKKLCVESIKTKGADDFQKFAIQILELLNRSSEKTDLITKILTSIKEFTGIEAVGIRLPEGEDFPYYEAEGFNEDFLAKERLLCALDKDGEIIRDTEGRPILECMCGNVISGNIDPHLSFFTSGGSFWTNCTTDLLASTTDQDRQSHTRNRCNGVGYESVALIPIRVDDEIIGLLQLNDKRKGMFNLVTIEFFEGIGASIGIAFSRMQNQEKLRETERLKGVIEMAGAVCHEMNQPLMAISGYSELIAMGITNDGSFQKNITKIIEQVDRLGKISRKLMTVTRYKTKDYLNSKIVDIEKSSNVVTL